MGMRNNAGGCGCCGGFECSTSELTAGYDSVSKTATITGVEVLQRVLLNQAGFGGNNFNALNAFNGGRVVIEITGDTNMTGTPDIELELTWNSSGVRLTVPTTDTWNNATTAGQSENISIAHTAALMDCNIDGGGDAIIGSHGALGVSSGFLCPPHFTDATATKYVDLHLQRQPDTYYPDGNIFFDRSESSFQTAINPAVNLVPTVDGFNVYFNKSVVHGTATGIEIGQVMIFTFSSGTNPHGSWTIDWTNYNSSGTAIAPGTRDYDQSLFSPELTDGCWNYCGGESNIIPVSVTDTLLFRGVEVSSTTVNGINPIPTYDTSGIQNGCAGYGYASCNPSSPDEFFATSTGNSGTGVLNTVLSGTTSWTGEGQMRTFVAYWELDETGGQHFIRLSVEMWSDYVMGATRTLANGRGIIFVPDPDGNEGSPFPVPMQMPHDARDGSDVFNSTRRIIWNGAMWDPYRTSNQFDNNALAWDSHRLLGGYRFRPVKQSRLEYWLAYTKNVSLSDLTRGPDGLYPVDYIEFTPTDGGIDTGSPQSTIYTSASASVSTVGSVDSVDITATRDASPITDYLTWRLRLNP